MNGIGDVAMSKRARRLNSINDLASADFIQEVNSVKVPDVGEVQVKVVKGDFSAIPVYCQQFIARYVSTLSLAFYRVARKMRPTAVTLKEVPLLYSLPLILQNADRFSKLF